MYAKSDSKVSKGFTIVELLIVVVVIAILASIAIVAYAGIQTRARDTSVIQDLNSLEKKIQVYSIQNNNLLGNNVTWNSKSGANSNLQFTASQGNVIDVVANDTDYCIRIYNARSGIYNTLNTAATRGSSADSCTTLGASAQATGVLYSESFNSDSGGWSGTAVIARNTSLSYSAPASLCLARGGTGTYFADKVITGLIPGTDYRLSAQLLRTSSSASQGTIRINEVGGSPSFTGASNSWVFTEYEFTATATSHTIRLSAYYVGTANFCIDDVTLRSL